MSDDFGLGPPIDYSLPKVSSSEALRETMQAEKAVRSKGLTEIDKANVISRHGIERDLGAFSDPLPVYDPDDEARDRLIAHARQDAAQAVILATFILRRQRRTAALLWVAVGLLAYIAWAVS